MSNKMKTITITEIMNGAWKERSLVTAEERGIPQIADGMKPVQRFVVYQGYKTAKQKFDKVAAISGSIAALGYEHGENSAANALTSMTAEFSNNFPFFEGDGAFGNVLDPTPAASRYIFAKLSPYIDDLIKDTELAPEHNDPEVIPPLYYLPIIPMCLVNGIKGIATGYATDIPPHDVNSIIDNLIRLCDGKEIKEIKPKYYNFTGNVERVDDHYVLTGTYEKKSPVHFVITELPHIFNTSQSYENFLRKLVDKGVISSYDNNSGNDRFNFDVWIKKGSRWTDEDIVKKLKLSCNHTWNLTTVMPNGKLYVWDKKTGIEDIVKWFYNFRVPFIQKRIDNMLIILKENEAYYKGFIKFLKDVINQKVVLKKINEEDLENLLRDIYKIPEKFIEKVKNSPIRSFTNEKIETLKEKLEETENNLKYYKNTTKETEYKKDLEILKKSYKKYCKE